MQQEIKAHLEQNGGMITSTWCRKNNIPTVYLSRMVKSGMLCAAGSGIYYLSDAVPDEFMIFQSRYTKTVFSYETALYLLHCTDKIPHLFDVTVENHYKFNVVPQNVQIHYVQKNILTLGTVEAETPYGNKVTVYSLERTVCDFIKQKESSDPEIYTRLLKTFASSKEKNITALYEYASLLSITDKVRNALEVLL